MTINFLHNLFLTFYFFTKLNLLFKTDNFLDPPQYKFPLFVHYLSKIFNFQNLNFGKGYFF